MKHAREYASKPGKCRCLKCLKMFKSPDKARIRFCKRCTKQNDSPSRAKDAVQIGCLVNRGVGRRVHDT